MEHGKLDEAIDTLRLGYEMSDKVGREPTLVSASSPCVSTRR
jgi:hypothetical protein